MLRNWWISEAQKWWISEAQKMLRFFSRSYDLAIKLWKAVNSLPESFPSYRTWEHASGCGLIPVSQACDLEHKH